MKRVLFLLVISLLLTVSVFGAVTETAIAPLVSNDDVIGFSILPIGKDAFYVMVEVLFTDWSERYSTYKLREDGSGDIECQAGGFTYYCPNGTESCMALTAPITRIYPRCGPNVQPPPRLPRSPQPY
jgi:hypothetical protein